MRELKFREPMFKDGKFHHFEYWGWHNPKTKEFTPPRNYSNAVWKTSASEEYTGLKDKTRTPEYPNGVEIYEGDVVRVDEDAFGVEYGGHPKIDIVEIRPPRLWLKHEGFGHEGENLIMPGETEVIGNVHENPELLEVK